MDIHNSQFGAGVEYDYLDRGTPAWAVKPGPGAIAPIPAVPGTTTVSENFEGTLWSSITFGGGDWTVDGTQAHSPTKSFRSKVIGNNATSTFTIYNDTFDPQISFWTRYITESGFDFLTVKVDGVNMLQLSGSQLTFQRHAITIGFGYQIDFIYSKDFSSAPAGDGVWIDDIVFGGLDTPAVPGSPAHALVYSPLYVDVNNRLKVTLLGEAIAVSGNIIADSNFDYPEDSPHVSGNPGAFVLAVRNDDPLNPLTSADGDYSPIGVTSTGRVQTTDRANFAEDTPHTSGHFGEFVLAVRNDDPLNAMTDSNGDYSPIAVTNTGRVYTTDRSNFAEDTPASSGHFGNFVLGIRNDAAAVKTDTDGDYSQISVDSAGRVGISDLGGSITVDGSVAVSGTVSVSNMNIQHTEDTPVVSGDIGHLMLAMRHDAGTGTVDADGDYSALHVNGFGQLKVDIGGQTISLSSNSQAFPNASMSNVAGSATSVLLLASNANRRKVYLTNESLSVARIAFGSAASATNYTIVLLANQTYVIEYPCYTGAMNVIWDLAVGNMRTTEVTI